MVRRVFRLMYSEVRGLHQAAYLLAFFTLGSQLLALVRDRLLAHQFGAGVELDIYYAAFRIPDLLYVLFASTLSVYVLIPFVSARVRGDDQTTARALLSQVATVFTIAYCLLALGFFVAAPYLVPYLVPGHIDYADELVTIMRVLLLQPFLLGLSSLFGVITQLGHRFMLYALAPIIYNLGIIIGIVFLYPVFGIVGLGYGVVLGAAGHLAIQWPFVAQSPLRFGLTLTLDFNTLRQVLRVSVPRALTLALHQVTLLVLVVFASMMTVGSVAVFQFAYNLQSVPLAIIGASYSIAAFPLLADLYAQRQLEQFRQHVVTALRHIIFWSLPVIGLIVVLRAQLVRVILGSGSFDWADTRLTAAVLAVLALSLLAQAINLLIVRTFYAGGYTRVPFFVTTFGMAATIAGVYLLAVSYQAHPAVATFLATTLRIDTVPGSEVVLLAFGYSIGIIAQTVIMVLLAARTFAFSLRVLLMPLGRAMAAACGGGLASYVALNFFVFGINPESTLGVFLHGLLGALAGAAGIIATYHIVRAPELREAVLSIRSRFLKTEVVTVQDDVL